MRKNPKMSPAKKQFLENFKMILMQVQLINEIEVLYDPISNIWQVANDEFLIIATPFSENEGIDVEITDQNFNQVCKFVLPYKLTSDAAENARSYVNLVKQIPSIIAAYQGAIHESER